MRRLDELAGPPAAAFAPGSPADLLAHYREAAAAAGLRVRILTAELEAAIGQESQIRRALERVTRWHDELEAAGGKPEPKEP